MEREGIETTVHRTRARGDGRRIARELATLGPGATLLVVGGDGSVHEAAAGLLDGGAGHDLPALAILPAGSGNDLARHLGIRRAPRHLAALLRDGTVRPVDAWRLEWPGGGEWFVNVASVGFSATAARIIDARGKRLGGASYVWGALLAFVRHRDVEVAVRVDGGPVEAIRLGAAVLANGPWFGAGMHVSPGARTDDGLLDFLTVGGAGRLRLLALLAGVFTGRHLRSRAVHLRRVGRLELAWQEPLAVEADGEPLEASPPLSVTGRAGALRFLVPGRVER